jgi:hypothetical protein
VNEIVKFQSNGKYKRLKERLERVRGLGLIKMDRRLVITREVATTVDEEGGQLQRRKSEQYTTFSISSCQVCLIALRPHIQRSD